MRAALIVSLVALANVTHAAPTPGQELNDGRNQFYSRNWNEAYHILGSLIYPSPRLSQPDELVEAYVMAGTCLVELGRAEEAKPAYKRALELQPERHILPGGFYSDSAIRVFEDTRAEIIARDKKIEDARRQQEQLDQIEQLRKSIVTFEEHSYFRNFVPFGAPQFQNDTPIRGIALAASQTAFLGTSVVIWGYLVNTYGLTNATVPPEDGARVRLLQQVEIVSGVGFFVLYAVGIVDGLRNYQPKVRKDFDEDQLLTPEQKKLLNKVRAPKKSSFHITPILAPDSIGLGLSWEN